MASRVDFRDVTADAPVQLHFPAYVRGFEELGFVRLGRVGRIIRPGGYESVARRYPVTQRATLLRMTEIPPTVLAAADRSAFVVVDWWWGMPEVRLRTALTTGAVVETRRAWDTAPVWRSCDARGAHRFVLAAEQCQWAAEGHEIHLVAGDACALWRAHQRHVDAYRQTHGGELAAHEEITQAVELSRRLAAHDLRVQRRKAVVQLAALGMVFAVLVAGVLLSSLVWLWGSLLVPAVAVLVLPWLCPTLGIWVRYERRLRPKFA